MSAGLLAHQSMSSSYTSIHAHRWAPPAPDGLLHVTARGNSVWGIDALFDSP